MTVRCSYLKLNTHLELTHFKKRTYNPSCPKGLLKNTASLIAHVEQMKPSIMLFVKDYKEPSETASVAIVNCTFIHCCMPVKHARAWWKTAERFQYFFPYVCLYLIVVSC